MENQDLYHITLSEGFRPVVEGVKAFIENEVQPLSDEFANPTDQTDRWSLSPRQAEILDGLKDKAKAAGYWNFFLPGWNGEGITNLDYAYLAEEMGKNFMASEVFNCSAPDTGNMEVLHKYGTEEQKAEWLEPLLDGKIRSCFGMTEPDVACSDASNIVTSAVLEGDEYVINGEKYYISGAGDARCKIMILMVNTNPDGPRHQQHSQILVPMDTPGVNIVGPMEVFGHDGAPHGHMHLKLENVRVPKENMILGEGRGFEVAQGRLGPGRIHHCMRAIGQAEAAIEMMCKRGLDRVAFGRQIAKLGGNYDVIARSRNETDGARMLVLRAARAMDVLGNQEARFYIHQIKAILPEVTCEIIDRAIQIHGATGISQWTPLAAMYAGARTLRFADGPDEVHRMVVARHELKKYG